MQSNPDNFTRLNFFELDYNRLGCFSFSWKEEESVGKMFSRNYLSLQSLVSNVSDYAYLPVIGRGLFSRSDKSSARTAKCSTFAYRVSDITAGDYSDCRT